MASGMSNFMEWTSLKKKKPPGVGLYLVHAFTGDKKSPFIAIDFFDGKKFGGLVIPFWSKHYSHWMALPKSPKRVAGESNLD